VTAFDPTGRQPPALAHANGHVKAGGGAAEELLEVSAEVELARARVASSMRALGEEVAHLGDWRARIRERPVLVLAAALALGFLAGRRGRPWSSRSRNRK
jgi:hypothetical protein